MTHALLLLSVVALADQAPGRVMGIVRDLASGEPLAGVHVRLLGTDHVGLSNADGGYLLPDVTPGRYRITFEPVEPLNGTRVDTVDIAVVAGLIRQIDLYTRPARVSALAAANIPWMTVDSGGGRIFGRVTDAETGRPVAGADVLLLTKGLDAQTDGTGRFVFERLPPGRHVVETHMLSYVIRRDTIVVYKDQYVDAYVQLARDPVELPPIQVVVRSRYLQRSGFYARRDDPSSFGHFLGEQELAQRASTNLPDLLQTVPGVLVEYRGLGQRVVAVRRPAGLAGNLCLPHVYLDGIRQRDGSILNDIPPSAVEAVEAYTGPDAPLEYRSNSCGAILVWTKHGG